MNMTPTISKENLEILVKEGAVAGLDEMWWYDRETGLITVSGDTEEYIVPLSRVKEVMDTKGEYCVGADMRNFSQIQEYVHQPDIYRFSLNPVSK